MRRVALAAILVAGCTPAAPTPPAEYAHHPYRDIPQIPHRKVPAELPEQYALPAARGPRASRSRATSPARNSTPAAGDIWAALARCESGMRQDAVGGGGRYLSYFQWLPSTWRSVKAADDPADPRDASYDTQVAAAQKLQARSGWGQWPACARRLGLVP